MLSTSGIQDIHNSIRDYTGFIERITESVGAPIGRLSVNIEEILEFFNEFNVLLIIDNLETILEKDIRYFIREAQQRCKIAITSRVGLGELEFPRKLTGLTEEESTKLVREISIVRNSEVLRRLSNSQLSKIANQLHFNPLAIKWFVNSVDSGKSPKEVLNNKDDLLNFCLSNVYEKLSENAKLILSTLLAARKQLNDAELNFLTSLSPLDMRKALNRLFVTTLARREVPASSEISECVYSVSDFTKKYLLAQHPPEKRFVQTIANKMKKLSTSYEEASRVSRVNEFSFKAFEVRTQNEKVICRYLLEALRLSKPKQKRYDDAIRKVNEAREIVPNYFEVYRVSAFIKSYKGDLLGAEDDYKIAIEMEPENVRLLYFYAGFLLYQMDDVSAALPYAKKAYELRPSTPETVGLYARCVGYLGNYEEAVELLEKVLEAGSIASVKSKKIITTVIIDFYRRWANSVVELNQDYKLAIEKLKCSVSVFEKADNSSESDYNMVKNFSEAILWLLRYCAEFENEDERNAASNMYKKYEIYIDQTPYSSDCKELFENKYSSCQIDWDVNPTVA
jgi:tetratricopeptide (TPR) repeat protein